MLENDLDLPIGGDLSLGPTGDIAVVSQSRRTQQRVLRRLLTSPGAAIFHPSYGGGLAAFVGQPLQTNRLLGVITGQMLLEASVAKTPSPTVSVSQGPSDPTSILVNISYFDAAVRASQKLAFTLGS